MSLQAVGENGELSAAGVSCPVQIEKVAILSFDPLSLLRYDWNSSKQCRVDGLEVGILKQLGRAVFG